MSRTALLNKDYNLLYFGLAHLVDEPSELWYSGTWVANISICSGIFAKYSTDKNEPIIPLDFVIYSFNNMPQIDRVKWIYNDEYKNSPYYRNPVTIVH